MTRSNHLCLVDVPHSPLSSFPLTIIQNHTHQSFNARDFPKSIHKSIAEKSSSPLVALYLPSGAVVEKKEPYCEE